LILIQRDILYSILISEITQVIIWRRNTYCLSCYKQKVKLLVVI